MGVLPTSTMHVEYLFEYTHYVHGTIGVIGHMGDHGSYVSFSCKAIDIVVKGQLSCVDRGASTEKMVCPHGVIRKDVLVCTSRHLRDWLPLNSRGAGSGQAADHSCPSSTSGLRLVRNQSLNLCIQEY